MYGVRVNPGADLHFANLVYALTHYEVSFEEPGSMPGFSLIG